MKKKIFEKRKKLFLIIFLFVLSGIFIFGGNFLNKFSDIPLEGYSISIFRDNSGDILNIPFEYILDFYFYYDFEEERGNLSFRIIDEKIDKISVRLPGWCNNENLDSENLANIDNLYSIVPLPQNIPNDKQVYSFNLNLSCPGMPSNARIALFLNANYSSGAYFDSEHNGNDVLFNLKLPKKVECSSECVTIEYSSSDSVRADVFDRNIKVYTIRGFHDPIKTVQFYIKTYEFNWVFWSNLLRDLGIALLASLLFYLLMKIKN